MMLKLDPIWQPDTQQANFRLLLDAMAHPGCCYELNAVLIKGLTALPVLATLLDAEVSLADPYNLLREKDWSMLQAKTALPAQADYILCNGSHVPNFAPKLGALPCPEQSATLLLTIDQIGHGDINIKLSGPGIQGFESLAIKGLLPQWLLKREEWVSSFPLGVDLMLIAGCQVIAIPRSTKVEIM